MPEVTRFEGKRMAELAQHLENLHKSTLVINVVQTFKSGGQF